jgi:hypothetical protein
MALTIVNNEASASRLSSTVTTITVGVAGDYSAGGIALTPAQLGFGNEVFYGSASVLTPGGAGTVTDCTLDCTNPKAPKLKANAAAAEAAGAGVAGAVLVVVAWGD